MRILHTIEGFDAQLGGISSCTYELLSSFNRDSITVDLLTPMSKGQNNTILGTGEPWIKTFSNDCISPIQYTAIGKRILKGLNYDIYHINGLWKYINHISCQIAREKGVPYVISPHGMLYPEALKRSSWKKYIVRKLWFNKDVKNAACIHATCIKEMDNIRDFGYTGPIAIIANPINIPEYTDALYNEKINRLLSIDSNKVLNLGFLGRIHPIKKIENIIYGASKVKNVSFEIHIIGSGLPEYEEFLKSEIKRLGLSDKTYFHGFVNGYDKFSTLSNLSVLFLPSEMENFGMIVPESLSVGTPVVASTGTPWQSLVKEQCGWWNACTPDDIAEAILKLSSIKPQDLTNMAFSGRNFVLREFEASKISSKMHMLYKYLLGHCEKPDFIYEN